MSIYAIIKKDTDPNLLPSRPPTKWAEGKSQLISQFETLFPKNIKTLVESFADGAISPATAMLNPDRQQQGTH